MEFQHGQPARQRTTRRPRPEDDGIARCRHCGAKIIWAFPVPSANARSAAGRDPNPMPLDYEPDKLGVHTLFEEGPSRYHPKGCLRAGTLTRGQAQGWRDAGNPTYQRHFKTCAKKEEWGKRGQAYSTRDVTR